MLDTRNETRKIVGRDEEERRERGIGEKGRGARIALRRSTHGRVKNHNRRERERGRKTGTEVRHRRVNRDGEYRYSVPALTRSKMQQVKNVGMFTDENSREGRNTILEGGRKEAWGTRRQPNRYETYREGSRRSRVSVVRARHQAQKEVDIYM